MFLVAGGATALACVGIAALSQVHENRVARWLTWAIAAALWLLLGLSATQGAGAVPSVPLGVGLAVAALLVVVAAALFWRARSRMAGVSRRVLGYTAHLSPSLSGALSSVDLGLMYDVLLARRWGRGARVRPRTGGPLGWPALVHRDLLRARRGRRSRSCCSPRSCSCPTPRPRPARPGGRARHDAPRAARRPRDVLRACASSYAPRAWRGCCR